MSTKMQFGFSAVQQGQRVANNEPQFVAVSTEGAFRLTPAVTSVLQLQMGDSLMFVNNIPNIDEAIRVKADAVVAFCEENGLDITTPEAVMAIHKAFDQWGIAKGIQEYDSKGIARIAYKRLTKEDKIAIVERDYDAIFAATLESGKEELISFITDEASTREEIIEKLSDLVKIEVPKQKGSLLANVSKTTGYGTTLNCSDGNVWKQLKQDMEDATAKNRVFDVDVEDVQTIVMNDGFKDVEVRVLLLGEYTDSEPVRRKGEDA